MMDSPELIILDVGHGNCAIARDTNGVVLIDCSYGATLIETLEHLSITEISHVLISHSDADHIAGVLNLLSHKDIRVHNVHLNPDAIKKSAIWQDLRSTLRDARIRCGTNVSSELTTNKNFNIGSVNIEILAPAPELILGGAGGTDLQGRRLTSNSISAVIGIVHDSFRVAILAADIDSVGFDNLIQDNNSLNANILVFPHHGGMPGSGDASAFAQDFCTIVKPKLIIFSIGRNRFNNPRIEIVDAIISSVPGAHILCTQLSKQCTDSLPIAKPKHLSILPAKGLVSNSCCGGTITIKIDGIRSTYAGMALHKNFISNQLLNPICSKMFDLISNEFT